MLNKQKIEYRTDREKRKKLIFHTHMKLSHYVGQCPLQHILKMICTYSLKNESFETTTTRSRGSMRRESGAMFSRDSSLYHGER